MLVLKFCHIYIVVSDLESQALCSTSQTQPSIILVRAYILNIGISLTLLHPLPVYTFCLQAAANQKEVGLKM